MATFSTNQTRQLYVATATNGTTFKGDTAKSSIYLTQTNATGEPVRSDLIDVKNIISVTAKPAASMERALKAVAVTLDTNVNEGKPVVGQDYILHINFRQYASLGDQDIYVKHGAVRIFKGMTASDFYREMAISLAKNFSRELTPLVKIHLTADLGLTEVKPSDTKETLVDTYTSLVIVEAEQEWVLGIKPQESVYFDVVPTTIIEDGEEVTWGVTEEDVADTVGNGKLIADLEYFCMGERGDVYRNIGWPNTVPTKYLVDATKEYDVLDIHYAYVGSNESVQKSEKTITVVGENADLAKVITAFNAASGITVTLK